MSSFLRRQQALRGGVATPSVSGAATTGNFVHPVNPPSQNPTVARTDYSATAPAVNERRNDAAHLERRAAFGQWDTDATLASRQLPIDVTPTCSRLNSIFRFQLGFTPCVTRPSVINGSSQNRIDIDWLNLSGYHTLYNGIINRRTNAFTTTLPASVNAQNHEELFLQQPEGATGSSGVFDSHSQHLRFSFLSLHLLLSTYETLEDRRLPDGDVRRDASLLEKFNQFSEEWEKNITGPEGLFTYLNANLENRDLASALNRLISQTNPSPASANRRLKERDCLALLVEYDRYLRVVIAQLRAVVQHPNADYLNHSNAHTVNYVPNALSTLQARLAHFETLQAHLLNAMAQCLSPLDAGASILPAGLKDEGETDRLEQQRQCHYFQILKAEVETRILLLHTSEENFDTTRLQELANQVTHAYEGLGELPAVTENSAWYIRPAVERRAFFTALLASEHLSFSSQNATVVNVNVTASQLLLEYLRGMLSLESADRSDSHLSQINRQVEVLGRFLLLKIYENPEKNLGQILSQFGDAGSLNLETLNRLHTSVRLRFAQLENISAFTASDVAIIQASLTSMNRYNSGNTGPLYHAIVDGNAAALSSPTEASLSSYVSELVTQFSNHLRDPNSHLSELSLYLARALSTQELENFFQGRMPSESFAALNPKLSQLRRRLEDPTIRTDQFFDRVFGGRNLGQIGVGALLSFAPNLLALVPRVRSLLFVKETARLSNWGIAIEQVSLGAIFTFLGHLHQRNIREEAHLNPLAASDTFWNAAASLSGFLVFAGVLRLSRWMFPQTETVARSRMALQALAENSLGLIASGATSQAILRAHYDSQFNLDAFSYAEEMANIGMMQFGGRSVGFATRALAHRYGPRGNAPASNQITPSGGRGEDGSPAGQPVVTAPPAATQPSAQPPAAPAAPIVVAPPSPRVSAPSVSAPPVAAQAAPGPVVVGGRAQELPMQGGFDISMAGLPPAGVLDAPPDGVRPPGTDNPTVLPNPGVPLPVGSDLVSGLARITGAHFSERPPPTPDPHAPTEVSPPPAPWVPAEATPRPAGPPPLPSRRSGQPAEDPSEADTQVRMGASGPTRRRAAPIREVFPQSRPDSRADPDDSPTQRGEVPPGLLDQGIAEEPTATREVTPTEVARNFCRGDNAAKTPRQLVVRLRSMYGDARMQTDRPFIIALLRQNFPNAQDRVLESSFDAGMAENLPTASRRLEPAAPNPDRSPDVALPARIAPPPGTTPASPAGGARPGRPDGSR